MTDLFLAGAEVGNSVAALDYAALGNCPAGVQERFGELGFSGVAWADQADVANVSCCISHKAIYLRRLRIMSAFHRRAISHILTKPLLINRVRTLP